jgi:hypothetical protein
LREIASFAGKLGRAERLAQPPRALLQGERLCALAHGGAIAASVADRGFPAVELSAFAGAKTLIAEACP